MEFDIVHELPKRLRMRLALPAAPVADREEVEAHFHDLSGIKQIRFSPRTRSLLLGYDGRTETRSTILKRLAAAPDPGRRRPRTKTGLDKKKAVVIRSGGLLLARPLIPPPVRPFLAFWGALPIFKKGMTSLGNRRLDVDVLDSAAIGAAMTTRDFATASVISFLLKLSEYLEEWARGHSRKLLSDMFHIGEEWAWVERDGSEVRVPVAEVAPGETLVVRMGSLVPVDGLVQRGEALVNQSSLTGESQPVLKRKGAPVYAGTAVEEGALRVTATRVGDQTRAARVVKVIEEAESLKAQTQSQSEQLADKVVPYSFLLSGLTYALTGRANRAAAVLLVDYSCAIKLSTPLVILSSLARAARNRVLIKGGKYLEALSKVDAFILDKTGTLTHATPKVVTVKAFNGFDSDYILQQAACVEEHFPHPVAKAVVRHAEARGLVHPEEHAEVEYILAHGIVSRLHGNRILVGSRHFINEDERVDVSVAEPHIEAFAARGESVLYVAIGKELAGLVSIHDPLREEARSFIGALKDSGVERVVMLTGDNEATARTVAERLDIDDFQAQAFPEAKVAAIKALRNEGYTVAMVGDGINDSPALAHADVGISMKHGAEIAQEACDVLLMDGTLTDLITGRQIAQEAMSLIRENSRQIIIINSLAMAMAITGTLPPILSAALHNLSTIATGLRALKPLRIPRE